MYNKNYLVSDYHVAIKLRIMCFVVALLMSFISMDIVMGKGFAFASDSSAITFTGNVQPLVGMLRGMVRLARITMMFVAALLGIICGVMWYTGQQQAQGMLQKFFVAVFFIFGATAILDAILGMTLGNITIDVSKTEANMKTSNEQWMGQ